MQSLYFESYIVALRAELAKLNVGLTAKDYHVTSLDQTEAIDSTFGVKHHLLSEISQDPYGKWSVLFYSRNALQNTRVPVGRAHKASVGQNVADRKTKTRKYKRCAIPINIRIITNSRLFADKVMQWYFVDGSESSKVSASIDLEGDPHTYSIKVIHDLNALTQEDNVEQQGESNRIHLVGWDVVLEGIIYSPLTVEFEKIEKIILSIWERNTGWSSDETFSDILEATMERDLTLE